MKFHCLFEAKEYGEGSGERYSSVYQPNGSSIPASRFENEGNLKLPDGARLFLGSPVTSDGAAATTTPFDFENRSLLPKANQHWKTTLDGMQRLVKADRLFSTKEFLNHRLFIDDFAATPLSNLWSDTMGTAERDKAYVVQTTTRIIERCLLMTTDPGDLVLDPTCGSGTTAYVAEQWGRRWITMDVSRVALAIARQRLLTAKFDYYRLRPTSAEDVQRNPDGSWLTDPVGQIPGSCTFDCKTVPHITLKSIAQNQALDPIFDKWTPILAEKLAALNAALRETITKDIRTKLLGKLVDQQKREGKRAVIDADLRRWRLPEQEWREWEAPFDTDPVWPQALQDVLTAYRTAWRQKMDEVNACIAARADWEELVDQPFIERGRVRVSGPFTMEGIIPAEESIDTGEDADKTPIGGAPEELETFDAGAAAIRSEAQNTEAYLDRMIRLLRGDGVRFPDNKIMKFRTLETLADGSTLHAKGAWGEGEEERLVAVVFGPQYGPLTTRIVE
ncbi:MAG: class I SAM-dependent methyltransferase, partial [Syntrophales bacterium]|nr:class I SAM-dependent methyltransferase [Syntrophales bacterium]